MNVRWILPLVATACAGCGADPGASPDSHTGDPPHGGAPARLAVGALCAGAAGNSARANIGVDSLGNALVAWQARMGDEQHITACRLRQGAWAPVLDVGLGSGPVVALAADGSGVLAWGGVGSLMAAPYVGGELGPPVAAAPQEAADYDLATLPDGDAVLLASGIELRSYHYDAQANLWDPTPLVLPTTAGAVIGSLEISPTADGAIAVWQEHDLATRAGTIRAARFDPGAREWTSPASFANVAAAPGTDRASIVLDTSPPGHALVVLPFADSDILSGSAFEVGASGWAPVAMRDRTPPPPLHPSGGIDASGRGWVTWTVEPAFDPLEIHGRRFDGAWGSDELLISTGHAVGSAVTVADAGEALLLWIQHDNPGMVLYGAVAGAQGTFGPGARLLDNLIVEVGSLRVATGPNGHSVAAWLAIPGGMTAAAIDW